MMILISSKEDTYRKEIWIWQQALHCSRWKLSFFLPGQLWSRAPIGSKINQCHFGALRFFVTRHPKYAPNFGAGQKNNQCHSTVALARWAPLLMIENSSSWLGFSILEVTWFFPLPHLFHPIFSGVHCSLPDPIPISSSILKSNFKCWTLTLSTYVVCKLS